MSTQSTVGGIAAIVVGVLVMVFGKKIFVSKDGRTAPVSGEGADWIPIILGGIIIVGGIATLIRGGSG